MERTLAYRFGVSGVWPHHPRKWSSSCRKLAVVFGEALSFEKADLHSHLMFKSAALPRTPPKTMFRKMTFVNTGGNDLKDKYEVLQSVLLPQTGQKEFLIKTQRELMNEFSFQIEASPKDVKFFTLAGEPLPEDYLANGGTMCNFEYIKKKGICIFSVSNDTKPEPV